MHILFLSQRFLLPMDTGGKIRTGKILEQLSKVHDITLISNVESPKDDVYVPEMKRFCRYFIPVPWKELPKYSWKFFARLAVQMFSRYPVSALNSSSSRLRLALEQEAAKQGAYDLIVCDFVQSALEFQNLTELPSVLFQHNVESVIAKRHMDQSVNPVAKLFWWLQWKKMFAFERKASHTFDTVIAVSEKDKETFESLYGLKNVVTIPTGVDVDFFQPNDSRPEEPHTIVFCGSMDWLPNDDAAMFCIQDILPLVKTQIPDIRFIIVGRNPSPALEKIVGEHSAVELTGWVDDIRPHVAKGAIVIVPIRIGGGTRMKIYEAMAMGKAIISTSIGAEGLQFSDGQHLIIANEHVDFAEKIVKLLQHPAEREQLGTAARQLVSEHFGWARIAERFYTICNDTVQAP